MAKLDDVWESLRIPALIRIEGAVKYSALANTPVVRCARTRGAVHCDDVCVCGL